MVFMREEVKFREPDLEKLYQKILHRMKVTGTRIRKGL